MLCASPVGNSFLPMPLQQRSVSLPGLKIFGEGALPDSSPESSKRPDSSPEALREGKERLNIFPSPSKPKLALTNGPSVDGKSGADPDGKSGAGNGESVRP
jgi:hypothetical protein